MGGPQIYGNTHMQYLVDAGNTDAITCTIDTGKYNDFLWI